MKIITTNISDSDPVHDLILHSPIEKQVYDLFSDKFLVDYFREGAIYYITINGSVCSIDVGKKRVLLSASPPFTGEAGVRFDGLYPSVKLGYNKDVSKKIENFGEVIRKLQDLQHRAATIYAPHGSTVERILNRELATDDLQVHYWSENLFSDHEITFHIHPKGTAPADGVIVCLDNNKVVPFWNGSTARRSCSSRYVEQIDRAAGHNMPSNLEDMKKRVEVVERLQARLDAFDPTQIPELVALLDAKRQADELLREFNDLGK